MGEIIEVGLGLIATILIGILALQFAYELLGAGVDNEFKL